MDGKTYLRMYETDYCEECGNTLYEIHCSECNGVLLVVNEDEVDDFVCCPYCGREVA